MISRPTTLAPRLLLRIDADHSVGYGHAVRCSALVEAMGGATEVVVAGDDLSGLEPFFPGARFRSVRGEGLEAILACECPRAVIVDLPRHDADLWRLMRAHAPLVMAIDDDGGAVEADIVVNGAGPESSHFYPALPPGAIALTGPDHALLRPAFAQARWRDPGVASVAVVVGSGERARDWAFALVSVALDRSAWGEVRMVVGRSFPLMERLQADCARAGVTLLRGLDAQSMARHLATASVALITGGMIVPETLAVGTPAIVYPQVDNAVAEARWFAARGAVCDLGADGGMNMTRIATEVGRLLRDRDAAQRLSGRARELVDGRGAARVARALLSRIAAVEDEALLWRKTR